MNQAFIRDLQALLASGFTGEVTMHVQDGTVKSCEKVERWKPKTDGGQVELSEVAGGQPQPIDGG